MIWKQLRKISLHIPEELLAGVDESAKAQYMSRSEYIRYVLNITTAEQQEENIKKLEGSHNAPLEFADLDDS